MNDKVVLLSNCHTISLLKTDFHRINQILYAADKSLEVKICSKSYFFSKEQIILFSITAFLKILETRHEFHVLCPSDISEECLVSCFQEVFFLFSNSEQILISQNNALIFRYLSEVFENTVLFSICENVLSTNHPQPFFLSSEQFAQIPQNVFDSMNDFRILLNNEEIKCNHVFASLISNRIWSQLKEKSIQILSSLIFLIIDVQSSSRSFLIFSKEIKSKLMKAISSKFMIQFIFLNLVQIRSKASFKTPLYLLLPMIFLKFQMFLLIQLKVFFLLIFSI
jgi:hypothetical protein